MSIFNDLIPKETFKPEAAFRLIKSNNSANLCSLFLYQGTDFKKFEIDKVQIEHGVIRWSSKLIKFNPSGMMVRLTDDRGIIVVQKMLKSITFKLRKDDTFQFSYSLEFNPRLLEYTHYPRKL